MADLNAAMEKLKQIMSTEEGQAGIQNFLSNLNSGASNGGNDAGSGVSGIPSFPDEPPPAKENYTNAMNSDASSPLGNINPEMLKNVFSMMNGGGNPGNPGGKGSHHSGMLQSIKPYLSAERQGKLDMAAKLISLSKFAPLFKEL